jgi:cation/acetate symporter
MALGTAGTLTLIYLSPTVQIDILGHATAWFPLKNPALVTMPLSFAAGVLVSLVTARRSEAERYERVRRRMHLGAEAE